MRPALTGVKSRSLFSQFSQKADTMKTKDRLPLALFTLRISVFLVMLMWTLDKLVDPNHAARVFEKFYQISGLGIIHFYILGIAELILLLAFLVGYRKTLSYGLVLIFHAVSTFSSYQQYLDPFTYPNLLFFAAWPMLAACFVLYYLREFDTKLVV